MSEDQDLFGDQPGLYDDEGPSIYTSLEDVPETGDKKHDGLQVVDSVPAYPGGSTVHRDALKKKRQKKEAAQVQNVVFEQAMERLKSKRRRGEMSEQEASDRVTNVLTQMREAYEKDIELQNSGMPATAKLHMIELVVREVSKPVLTPSFMADGFLEVCALWLQPAVEGQLPNFTIRRHLLNLLAKSHVRPIQLILPMLCSDQSGTNDGSRVGRAPGANVVASRRM